VWTRDSGGVDQGSTSSVVLSLAGWLLLQRRSDQAPTISRVSKHCEVLKQDQRLRCKAAVDD
jgi:hypothetical protein